MKIDYHFNREFFFDPPNFGGIKIYQIGRAFCHNTTLINTHIHTDLFELTIVTGGEGIISTNGTPLHVEQNDIYLSFPHDAHKIESDRTNPLKFDFIAFNTDEEDLKNELVNIVENYQTAVKRVFRDERISSLIGNAINEFGCPQIFSKKLLSSIFHEMMIYLIRDFRKITQEKLPKKLRMADSLCQQIMNYIDNHIFTLKNLEDIAPIIGYSYSYLSALFRKTTSITLSRYFHEKKLDIGRVMILENKLKITEISENLNYSSVYAFSKAFSSQYGCSPREYRKNYKAKEKNESKNGSDDQFML